MNGDMFSDFVNSHWDDDWNDEEQINLRDRFCDDTARDAAAMQVVNGLRRLAGGDPSGQITKLVDHAEQLAEVLTTEMDAMIIPHAWAEKNDATVVDFLRHAIDNGDKGNGEVIGNLVGVSLSYRESAEVLRHATARIPDTSLPAYSNIVDEFLSLRYHIGYRQAFLLLSLLPFAPDIVASAMVNGLDEAHEMLLHRIARVQRDLTDQFAIAVAVVLKGD